MSTNQETGRVSNNEADAVNEDLHFDIKINVEKGWGTGELATFITSRHPWDMTASIKPNPATDVLWHTTIVIKEDGEKDRIIFEGEVNRDDKIPLPGVKSKKNFPIFYVAVQNDKSHYDGKVVADFYVKRP